MAQKHTIYNTVALYASHIEILETTMHKTSDYKHGTNLTGIQKNTAQKEKQKTEKRKNEKLKLKLNFEL